MWFQPKIFEELFSGDHYPYVGPYDFRDAENADRNTKSCHKNGIYCIKHNVTEFAKFWMGTSKGGQCT